MIPSLYFGIRQSCADLQSLEDEIAAAQDEYFFSMSEFGRVLRTVCEKIGFSVGDGAPGGLVGD
jgi:hypothetical protein